MLSPDELDPMVLSPLVLCTVVLSTTELDTVELGPSVLSRLVLTPVVLSPVEVWPDGLEDSELRSAELSADVLSPVDAVARDVDSDEIDLMELGPLLLGSVELGSVDVDSSGFSEDSDVVGSSELEDPVSEAVKLRELEEDPWFDALVRDEVSELAGSELVAPGELDCVPVVSGWLAVVRRSLVELLKLCSEEDEAKLLSGLELGLRLSDSLLPLLVCSEDADDARLLSSDVVASEVERDPPLVLLSGPDDVLDSTSLD